MLEWLQQDPWGFLRFMIYRAPAVLLALTLHELAHGYAAYRAGDPTAKMMGRLTLNPLRHLDLFGTIGMFLFGIGWAKPVPVNPNNFKNKRLDDLKVSLAGVTTNFILFLLATVFSILISKALYTQQAIAYFGLENLLNFQSNGFNMQLFPENDSLIQVLLKTPWLLHVQRFLFQLALVNLGMGLFNLLPIPPLDGFHVANGIFFGGKLELSGKVFQFTHMILMVILFATDFIGSFISKALYAIQGFILPALLALFGVS